MAIDVMNLISWPSERISSLFSPLAAPELWLCGPAVTNHSGTGKNFKRVRQLLSLTFLHEKIQVLVDPVNTCVTDTQPKRIIVENHGYTFFKRCKMLRR
jgi:hypothetical protein